MFLWPASWVNISHAGGRCSRSISVPTSGNTFLSPQHLESEKCKRNLESTNLRWRKFPKRCLYLGHSLDSSTRMGCSKMVIPSYPSALWWCPVASSNSSNSKLWHGEQGDLEAMGLAVFPSRTWAAHHLETTCFRCTDFNKNTQYPQCQYLLPNCGAQPEKANVAHTFIPYFLATLALWRFHKMECSHLWHQPRQGHWYCFFRSRWEQLTRETTSWAEFLNIRLQQGEIPAEYKETNCFVSSSENSNFPHGEQSYLESLPADLGSTSLGNNLLQMHWLQQEYSVSTMPISSTQLRSSTWESKCSSYFHSLFFSDTGAMALWQDGMQSLVTSAKTGALIPLLSQQMGTTDSRNHQLGWISEHKTSAGGNPRRVQGNKLLCQQFWKQQLPAWRAELFGIFACRLGKHITWKQPASDALTSARIFSIHNANIFYPIVELNQRKQLWLILSFFIF